MTRVVSLFLPTWSTDRLRRKLGDAAPPSEVPLVLISRDARRRVVSAVNRAALSTGLRVGMAATKAQALVSGLVTMDADPKADAEALERLALWAMQRYAPIVAADHPDGIVLDTTGADHLLGGEEAMLRQIVQRFEASGIGACAAIADTWGAAHALARTSAAAISVVPSGSNAAALERLSVTALRLPANTAESLRILGFTTIGQLERTPRAPLTLRFGPEVGRRLDRAYGRIAEPIDPIRTPDLIEVRRAFAEPIGASETIARYIGKLVEQLCALLETKGLGARRLDLLLHRVDNRIEAVRVGTALAVRDVRRLTRLLSDKIGTIDPGFGIELMTLVATIAEPLGMKQTISSLIEKPDADVSALIDTLTNRVGETRIYRVASVASDVPERSVKRVPALSPDTAETWPFDWPRPTRLLKFPERIETVALLPDHPPGSFTWQGIRHRIKRADGPERVFGEWWHRDAEMSAVRDYFIVEDEAGERFWIYRAGDGENTDTGSHHWFMHGLFG
ncbi:DNA polymerase Y family protein [Phyllobacterium sp. CCNWLW109]|uniref:Y-family DNA polymerase n=1 Tax=Phyllobacterium sp. CCNWLW109 TaxID=3127479 RepID=UPI003076E41B